MSALINLWRGMTGTVLPFAGTAAPNGWLMCYGQAVSRADYPNLFAVIGETYGAGDGATTFNVPDLRGRTVAGVDNMGGASANRLVNGSLAASRHTVGGAGGADTHTLSATEMPIHNHPGTTDVSANHTHTGSAASAGAHTHQVKTRTDLSVTGSGANALNSPDAGSTGTPTSTGMASDGAHTHAVTVDAGGAHSHVVGTNNAGGGGAHDNMQPTMLLNHIIRA